MPDGAVPISGSHRSYLTNLGLGYAIAISLGFLMLLSSILLASYVCCRSSRRRHTQSGVSVSSAGDGVIVPRTIFVTDGGEETDSENAVLGLDAAVINSYPKFPFLYKDGVFESPCSICLCEYKESEMMRMMPDCRHFFHQFCLDAWLKINGSCPVCRNSPLPTPMSTPLSEVVPLSQHRR